MLAKRTKTPTVFSGVIALATLYGCSLQDYDYLGAGNKPPDDETEEPVETEETTEVVTVDSSVESFTNETTDVTSDPDASVTSDPGESDTGSSSTSTTEITSSSPPEPTSEPASSTTTVTSEPPVETTEVDVTSAPPLPPLVVEGNLISNSSFESGVSPWVPFGNAVLVPSTDDSHTGETSLLTAGRNVGTYQSASIPLIGLMEAGKSYRLKVWTRMTTSVTTGFSVTAKAPCIPDGGVVDTNDPANYLQMGSGLARSDRWSEVTSVTFALPECDLAEFTIYFDGVPLGEDYYIDDVSLVEVTP